MDLYGAIAVTKKIGSITAGQTRTASSRMYASVRRRDRRQKAQAEEWITIFLVYDIASLFYYVSVLSPVPALRDIFLY